MLCLAGPMGDDARTLENQWTTLVCVIEAGSYFEAMTKYYALLGWGPYRTEFPEDLAPYPEEWRTIQDGSLAAGVENAESNDVTAPGAKVRSLIAELVEADLPKLAPHLREWAESHLADPHEVAFNLRPDGDSVITLWLVTDHVGSRDSSCRVVFDAETEQFGLTMQLANGVDWYMGPYGTFAQAIESM